jgi:hypothetical protein
MPRKGICERGIYWSSSAVTTERRIRVRGLPVATYAAIGTPAHNLSRSLSGNGQDVSEIEPRVWGGGFIT